MRCIAASLALLASCVAADAQTRRIGSWQVKREKDPFQNGSTTIAAVMKGSDILAIRCFAGKLSTILILPTDKRNFEAGENIDYKFRADEGPIVTGKGEIFSDFNVELPHRASILKGAWNARSLAFQVDGPGGSTRTIVFRLSQSQKALADIVTDCSGSIDEIQPSAAALGRGIDKDVILAQAADAMVLANKCGVLSASASAIALLFAENKIELGSNDVKAKLLEFVAAANKEHEGKGPAVACSEAMKQFGPTGTRAVNLVRKD